MTLFNNIQRAFCLILLSAIVLLVFFAACMRTVGYPIIWSVDVAQLLFAWLTMLAANQTLIRAEHAGVDLFTRRLSERSQYRLFWFFDVIMMLILTVIVWFGIELVSENPQRTLGSTDIPYFWVTLAFPTGATIMIISLIHRLMFRRTGACIAPQLEGDAQ